MPPFRSAIRSLGAIAAASLLLAGLQGCALPRVDSEPAVQRNVSEDDQTRITELRVRGQTQRLSVEPKNGAPGYEIRPAPGGQDASQPRDGAGQRVWPLLSF